MAKVHPKAVMAILKKNNIVLDKRVYEQLVKSINKEPNPAEKLEEFIKNHQK